MMRSLLVAGVIGLAVLVGCVPPPAPGGGPAAGAPILAASPEASAEAVGLLPTMAPVAASDDSATAQPPAASVALHPEALRSYRAKTEVRVETLTPESGVQAWTRTEARSIRGADGSGGPLSAMRVTELTDSETEGVTTETILAPGVVYLRGPNDRKWLRMAESAGAAITGGALGPDEIAAYSQAALSQGAVIAADEVIEGVTTTHYQITGAPLTGVVAAMSPGSGQLISGQMDLWIAAEGYVKQVIQDYVVQDGAGQQTRHTLTMLILDENTPIEIAVPQPSEYDELTMPAPPTLEPVEVAPTATAG